MQETVLARILDGVWNPHGFNNAISLVILPRDELRVYAGNLTKQQFEDLKHTAAFVTLHRGYEAPLQYVLEIIKPFSRSRFQNAV